MALACQEKTSLIDRKMYKKTNFRLKPWSLDKWPVISGLWFQAWVSAQVQMGSNLCLTLGDKRFLYGLLRRTRLPCPRTAASRAYRSRTGQREAANGPERDANDFLHAPKFMCKEVRGLNLGDSFFICLW